MLVKGPVMRVETMYNPLTDEHRCLVFQSNRNAPIAKLIWTLDVDEGSAHVKSVFVHETARGTGLGRLLFYQLFAALQRAGARLVRLEAEEDVKRHNRLVRFYESMGFHVTEGARVLYLNNYDDCYRKVPMYREMNPSFVAPELDESDSFMVVVLRSPGGFICGDEVGYVGVNKAEASKNNGSSKGGGQAAKGGDVERIWVLVQDAAGGVAMLEHHVGRFLCAEPDGKVVANRSTLSTWEVFELEPYEDQTDSARELFAFRTFHGKYLRFQNPPGSPRGSGGVSGPHTEGAYSFGGGGESAATPGMMISTSNEPTLWEVHHDSGGRHTGPRVIEVVPDHQGRRKKPHAKNQAAVRAIHRKMRRMNTVQYVQNMRASYCRFQIDRGMSIRQALDLLLDHHDPLLPDLSGDLGLCYADVLMAIAESIRAKGHPDWMQLLGILHGLGRVVFVLLHRQNYDMYEDWCFAGQSWVVGCQIPVTIRYPDVNELNDDFDHAVYSTPHGMYSPHCGLDSVMLNWSGAEYMYHFLQHNVTGTSGGGLPREALAMVRYVDLDMWYDGRQYDHLCNAMDHEMQDWVAQFARLRSQALNDLRARRGEGASRWREEGGEQQWGYYQALVDKYLPAELAW